MAEKLISNMSTWLPRHPDSGAVLYVRTVLGQERRGKKKPSEAPAAIVTVLLILAFAVFAVPELLKFIKAAG